MSGLLYQSLGGRRKRNPSAASHLRIGLDDCSHAPDATDKMTMAASCWASGRHRVESFADWRVSRLRHQCRAVRAQTTVSRGSHLTTARQKSACND
ncbi:hypothetical protein BGLA2_810042 [Burkholderia gladioli]|nr:hypothetical protein BGLA2_810042 [Burkholderia gladioli]